jgi:hypothetical protein
MPTTLSPIKTSSGRVDSPGVKSPPMGTNFVIHPSSGRNGTNSPKATSFRFA